MREEDCYYGSEFEKEMLSRPFHEHHSLSLLPPSAHPHLRQQTAGYTHALALSVKTKVPPPLGFFYQQ